MWKPFENDNGSRVKDGEVGISICLRGIDMPVYVSHV